MQRLKMQRLFLTLILLVFFLGCKTEKEKEDKDFILKGKLENAENITFSIEELTPQDLIPLDSISTDKNGQFAFRKEIEEAGFYIISISPGNSITLLIEPGEEIEMSCDADDLLMSCEIKGSEGSELMLKLNRKLTDSYNKLDSLADKYRESRYLPDFEDIREKLNLSYTEIYENQRDFVKSFIEEHQKSLASIIALNQYLGDQILLTMREDFEYFESLSKSLAEAYPSNKHVLDLKKQISNFKRRTKQRELAEEQLQSGKTAPEIVMKNPEDEQIALSSLRGNIVLIDFWAGWCPPCRQNNKDLKDIYNKYNDSGFEIYAVSLDRDRNEWLQGIKEDSLTWIQVSDLRFWNSPVVSLYNVEGIPYNVLIDEEGKIIDKGISTKELNKILDEKLPD
ncbi:MAG: TlpA disulfide reductase family protein [Bacteroidales bacterium]